MSGEECGVAGAVTDRPQHIFHSYSKWMGNPGGYEERSEMSQPVKDLILKDHRGWC